MVNSGSIDHSAESRKKTPVRIARIPPVPMFLLLVSPRKSRVRPASHERRFTAAADFRGSCALSVNGAINTAGGAKHLQENENRKDKPPGRYGRCLAISVFAKHCLGPVSIPVESSHADVSNSCQGNRSALQRPGAMIAKTGLSIGCLSSILRKKFDQY